MYDIAVIGGGPAGAVCAAACARAGRRVLLLERSRFPREKVCGDCVNPMAWPVLEDLHLGERVLLLPHQTFDAVRFIGMDSTSVRIPFPESRSPGIGIARSELDSLLLERARELGVEVHEDTPLIRLTRSDSRWTLQSNGESWEAAELVAADGRNSSVLRLLGMAPPAQDDPRIGLQTHFPAPEGLGGEIQMRFISHGYAGMAPIGNGRANLCLVGPPSKIESLRDWARGAFELGKEQGWRTIAPLSRAAIPPAGERLWLVGDAARVVEPFTGEGISYALRTGLAAARAILKNRPADYVSEHRKIYAGRLWVNRLARRMCLHPREGSALVRAGVAFPWILGLLTRKVVRA